MDVQTENTDPPPNESQPSGKIRKGFKLFGKRKPGNIFSIRSKGDGNNKSPVIKSKTLDGLLETPAPDSEQEADKEKGQEVSQGEMEHAEDEALGADGVLAAAPARTSISSVSSAKSLSFLSLLRGGRRGVGDRRVHTVSQPVGRQRRGLKGLFGNVKLRSKDKEEKEEAPPSPLLMSSRANSVEIIKEDLTLTPKCQPRSLDSPETESSEPFQGSITHDSAATSPSDTTPPCVTADNVSKSNDHVPPLPTSAPPLVPGENSLSSLLADISSLLTFDSISGGGDIIADVEAEWGKASALSPSVTDVAPLSTSLFTKSTISSSPVSTAFSTVAAAKPSYVSIPSSTITKPNTILTSFAKPSTLTSPSVKLNSDSTPASDSSASITVNLSSSHTTTKPPTFPVTLTSFSASAMSSASKTIQSATSSITTAATAPASTPSTVVKAPSTMPSPLFSASKPTSEITLPSQNVASVSKPSPVVSSPPVSAKPQIIHSPPVPVTQPPPFNLYSVSSLNEQKYTSYKPFQSLVPGESKAPMSVSVTCANTTKPFSPSSDVSSKMTLAPTFTTSGSVAPSIFKPTITDPTVTLNNTPTSPVTASYSCSSSSLTATKKIEPSPSSVSAPSTTLDKIPLTTKPTREPISLDKMPVPTTHAASAASPAPTALGQIAASPASTNNQVSVSKELPASTQIGVSQSKSTPASAHVPVSVTKEPLAPVKMQVTSHEPPAAHTVVSVSRDPAAPVKMQAIPPKDPPAPAQIPISVCKDPPVLSKTPVSVSKDPQAPAPFIASLPKDTSAPVTIPGSAFKAPPAPAQILVSLPKTHPAPVIESFFATSPPSPPAPLLMDTPISAKMKGSGQTFVDHQVASPGATGGQGSHVLSSKMKELANESQVSSQGPAKEKRPPQIKGSGLSKIPVVGGGGRVGKLPVRDSQNANDEPSRDPPTPVLEEKPHFNSHDAGSKDKISTIEANVPTSKHTQEESQQPQQPKVLTSSARDSKIPVKHGTQSHSASQISQTKEPPRTKIPVSKVPVRKAGSKPAPTGSGTQIRK